MSARGRTLVSTMAVLTVVGVVAGVVLFAGDGAGSPGPSHGTGDGGGTGSSASPVTTCPLTGVQAAGGHVPNRPVLAVKVENLPEARPQTGLDSADIVYEEPVEGGITRFIVVYQCSNAVRIEPIRSARLTDPDILDQFGTPIFGYAGGVAKVEAKVHQRGLIDVNYEKAASAYHRDGSRSAPHNLYSSTQALYAAAHTNGAPPAPVFTYSARPPAGALVARTVHLPFSGSSDVYWEWSVEKKSWLRSHGTVPPTLSDVTQVQAPNVVVQVGK